MVAVLVVNCQEVESGEFELPAASRADPAMELQRPLAVGAPLFAVRPHPADQFLVLCPERNKVLLQLDELLLLVFKREGEFPVLCADPGDRPFLFLHKIRDEAKFPDLEALRRQIAADELAAREYFAMNRND